MTARQVDGRPPLIASDTRFLFVYGTLQPGMSPPVISDVVDAMRIVGEASVAGRLYDLGAYPGCAVDQGCGALIHGVLMEMSDPAVLERLDWYEGYAAHDDVGASLFVRTTCEATMSNGLRVHAWIYVYGRDLSNARPIKGGRYDRKVK